MQLSDIAVMSTAWRRPAYLEQSLRSWAQADGISELAGFVLALGRSDDSTQQTLGHMFFDFAGQVGLAPRAAVTMDSDNAAANPGMHTAIAEAASFVFATVKPKFLIFTEEDIQVSRDVLAYMRWAATRFEGDGRVLAVCAHDVGGQGWDQPGIGLDSSRKHARQYETSLLPYFNPWCWGTWGPRSDCLDRWRGVLLPDWDWDATSGSRGYDSGYDWNIHDRLLPKHGMLCVVPEASRSQNLGRDGGYYAQPHLYEGTLSASYRADRAPGIYRLDGEP